MYVHRSRRGRGVDPKQSFVGIIVELTYSLFSGYIYIRIHVESPRKLSSKENGTKPITFFKRSSPTVLNDYHHVESEATGIYMGQSRQYEVLAARPNTNGIPSPLPTTTYKKCPPAMKWAASASQVSCK